MLPTVYITKRPGNRLTVTLAGVGILLLLIWHSGRHLRMLKSCRPVWDHDDWLIAHDHALINVYDGWVLLIPWVNADAADVVSHEHLHVLLVFVSSLAGDLLRHTSDWLILGLPRRTSVWFPLGLVGRVPPMPEIKIPHFIIVIITLVAIRIVFRADFSILVSPL